MKGGAARLSAVLERTSDLVSTATPDGRLTYLNPAGRRLVGWPETEPLEGRRIADLHPAWALRLVEGEGLPAAAREGLWEGETAILRRDGKEIPVSQVILGHLSDAGGVEFFSTIMRDVTRDKEAEHRLTVEKQFSDAVIDSLPGIFFVFDHDTRLVRWNANHQELLGLSAEAMRGVSMLDLVDAADHDLVLQKVRQVMDDGQATLEAHVLARDGRKALFRMTGVRLELDGEAFIVGTGFDITESRRVEEERERLASVIRHSQELVNLATVDGRMTFLNEAGAEMLGIAPADVPMTHVMEVIPESFRDVVEKELLPALGAGATWTGDLQYRNLSTGALTDVQAMAFTIKDPASGAPLFLANVSVDVTERKRVEQDKRRLEAQLQQAMKMEAIGRLAGGVAHDFNNLLTGISGNLSLPQLDLPAGDPLAELLAEAARAAESAAALTRQLLAFSRKQLIEPRTIDLNELVRRLHRMLVRLIGEDVELETRPGEGLWPVRVDPAQLEQILVNLAVNARDAMPDGGRLVVETRNAEIEAGRCARHPEARQGEHVALVVTDTGHGMTEEVKRHLFEPFFTTKPRGRGTGLGLATIYGAVTQAGGWVEVASEPACGSSFAIYLPRAAEPAESLGATRLPGGMVGGDETVLVVEDELSVRSLAVRILDRLGYRVLQAEDGEAALRLASCHEGAIDLLLTDVVMPGMNGRQLAERLATGRPTLRVLYASGYAEDAIAHHGVIDAGVDFIAKPYTPEGLAQKLRDVLDRP